MKFQKIIIIDTGIGNLYSISCALQYCKRGDVSIAESEKDIAMADKLILPGVGAFEDGMKGLRNRGLIPAIIRHIQTGAPCLGICLGMQLLAGMSEEFGIHEGLNLIPGKVVGIPSDKSNNEKRKIPFIGWASLKEPEQGLWDGTPLRGLKIQDSLYFVHSYCFKPESKNSILATYDYDGEEIIAAIRSKNLYGFQFHPEKSGQVGISLLEKFLDL